MDVTLAVQAVTNRRNGEPVSRPTALKIPPQVPLIPDGGAVGGLRWAEPAPWAATATPRARAIADGVTAPLARRLLRAARPTSRRPTPLRPTCHKAQRLARRSSRPEHSLPSGGPAPGVAGGQGDNLAGAACPESKRSAATKRGAGQFVKRTSETEGGRVPATAFREPASLGHGKGRPRHPVGAAGLTAEAANGGVAVRARDGSPSGSRHGPKARGSMRSTTARPRTAGTRPLHPCDPLESMKPPTSDDPRQRSTRRHPPLRVDTSMPKLA